MPTREEMERIVHDKTPVTPTKIFDDVWFVGRQFVGVFIVKTSEGIVLVDSGDPSDALERYIEPGMAELGLDPNEIKMVLLSHGHFDHYAGARHIQLKYGAKVGIGEIDLKLMMTCPAAEEGYVYEFPYIDFIIEDGKAITVGDHTFIPCLTPGHTAGTMSFVFNCSEKGEKHMVSLWGGTGLPREKDENLTMTLTCAYAASALKFGRLCKEQHCDVVLATHPHRCDYDRKRALLGTSETNPFIVGEDGVMENLKNYGMSAIEASTKRLESL